MHVHLYVYVYIYMNIYIGRCGLAALRRRVPPGVHVCVCVYFYVYIYMSVGKRVNMEEHVYIHALNAMWRGSAETSSTTRCARV